MNKLFSMLFTITSVVLLVSLLPAVSAHHSSNCNLRTTLSYAPTSQYSYGAVQYQQPQYWSAWNPVRLKIHYPYSSGNYAPYSGWNQHPGPYAHNYRPHRPSGW